MFISFNLRLLTCEQRRFYKLDEPVKFDEHLHVDLVVTDDPDEVSGVAVATGEEREANRSHRTHAPAFVEAREKIP